MVLGLGTPGLPAPPLFMRVAPLLPIGGAQAVVFVIHAGIAAERAVWDWAFAGGAGLLMRPVDRCRR